MYFNNQLNTKLPIKADTTIGKLKLSIKAWLSSQGIDQYSLNIIFNDGSMLNPEFNTTTKYDQVLLSNYQDFGINLYINTLRDIVTKEETQTGYQDLPLDIKRKLIYEDVDPKGAIELCRDISCDWQKLLDEKYDFVTQGFAPQGTPEQKFKYLANRVSQNINIPNNTKPEIIFVMFQGKPLGTNTFFQYERDIATEYMDDRDFERDSQTMEAIKQEFKKNPAIEWLRQDEYNMWIKVLDSTGLPDKILVKDGMNLGYRLILRDLNLYDYPSTRAEAIILETGENKYPGKVNINLDTLKSVVKKMDSDIEPSDLDKLYQEKKISFKDNKILFDRDNDTMKDIVKYSLEDINDWNAINSTLPYAVSQLMQGDYLDSFNRSEAELTVQLAMGNRVMILVKDNSK